VNTRLPLIPLLEPIRPDMEQVECLLHETLTTVEEPLRSALLPALGGGKRLRAALVVLVGRLFEVSTAPFYSLAAAVEVLHAATLIHDDVLDEASLRRGRGTLHTLWPVGATVLAGDYLLARSVSLVAELDDPRIVRILAQTLDTMCAGEIRQMLFTKGNHNRREDYYHSIEAKTASLFAAALHMAGILAGAGELQIDALIQFGRELGTAFQIVDDVLDLVADETVLGKPVGSDLRQGLITLPVLLFMEQEPDHPLLQRALEPTPPQEIVQQAVQLVAGSPAIPHALEIAQGYVSEAQAALDAVPPSPYRTALLDLAEFVVRRQF